MSSSMEFDLENPIMALNEHLFIMESDHMPSQNYLMGLRTREADASFRQEAISLIFKFSCNYEPSLSYLAINYLDRFLSKQGIPQGKQWIVRLLAASCVSLAAKMMRAESSSHSVFHWGEGCIFDPQTIMRLEMVILGALEWRMRSITPFSFFTLFISLLNLNDDPPLLISLKARASQFIIKSQTGIDILEFKPSTIAASAMLAAAQDLLPPPQLQCFHSAISSSASVDEESLLSCCKRIQEMMRIDSLESAMFDSAMVSSSSTVVNILDQQWWSSESTDEVINGDNEGITVHTTVASRPNKGVKRGRRSKNVVTLERRC